MPKRKIEILDLTSKPSRTDSRLRTYIRKPNLNMVDIAIEIQACVIRKPFPEL